MTYELFYTGIGGAIIGAAISSWLAYRFQLHLYKQQLAAQKESQAAFLASLHAIVEVVGSANTGLKGQISAEAKTVADAIKSLKRD